MSAEDAPMRPGQLACACPAAGQAESRETLAVLAAGFGLAILAQALVLSVLPEASRLMAPSEARIGWPFALLLAGAAAATFPAALLTDAFGRRSAFALGASLGVGGGLLCAHAVARGDFPLLCLGAFWLGLAQGFGLFYRHSAAQGLGFSARSGLAALGGGGAAALAAPLMVGAVAAFGGGAGTTLVVAALLHVATLALAVRLPHALDHAAFGRNRPNADNVIDSKSSERALCEKPVATFSQRALGAAPAPLTGAVTPRFVGATLAGSFAWFIMAAAMLRGPMALAMCSAGPSFIGGAMAWHLLAMFGPAALAARWPAYFPPRASVAAGLAISALAGLVLAQGASSAIVTAALLMIGVGWSLANIGALRLLHEGAGPQPRLALALHDLCLLGAAAAGALVF